MTTQIAKQTASNNLVYKTKRSNGKIDVYVDIRLNDECKNGHQDFAITADIIQAGKPKIDKYWIGGGCCHEEIVKLFPEFQIFVNLHLCDYEGIPMYAVENGFYHLRNGLGNTKVEDQNFKAEFCKYYRITPAQFDVLNQSRNQLQYALNLESLGILKQWKEEANKAIEYLEQLTGSKFLPDSKKSQFNAPTTEAIAAEEEKVKNGYYTPEAEAEREKERQTVILAKLEAERDKDIKKATNEFEAKKQVLLIGGEKALKNCIYYSHTQTIAFNWRNYDNISQELINKIAEQIQLPEGVKIENKAK